MKFDHLWNLYLWLRCLEVGSAKPRGVRLEDTSGQWPQGAIRGWASWTISVATPWALRAAARRSISKSFHFMFISNSIQILFKFFIF